MTSPFRNLLLPHERLAQRLVATRVGARLLAMLARAAGGRPAGFDWRRLAGPDFANQISTLEFQTDHLSLRTEAAGRRRGRSRLRLRTLWWRRLA